MTLKSYLWGMRISASVAFAAWVLVISYIDPETSGAAGQFLFFGSTFLFLTGLMIMFFTWMRRKISARNGEINFVYLGVSFRQGILIALLAVILLLLQQHRMLTWWDGALIVTGILLTELYFLTKR